VFRESARPPVRAAGRQRERDGVDDARDFGVAPRARDAERYWAREVTLRVLRDDSPFVARELNRQGRLNVGDFW
jgi:hypothetical protein